LPHIAGSLSASQEESTWVLTSYLVRTPSSCDQRVAFDHHRAKTLLYDMRRPVHVQQFLCGLAPAWDADFLPSPAGDRWRRVAAQRTAILADTFPASKRGMAFAVYGMPSSWRPPSALRWGGWITDNFTWRWIFYINVPIGLISLF